jgi:small subunit ribosomal protein S6
VTNAPDNKIILNAYEILLVFKPILDTDTVEGSVRATEDTIRGLGGVVHKIDRVGRKRMAFDIKRFKDGLVAVMHLELPPSTITTFRQACKLNEDILRMTLIKMDDPTIVPLNSTTCTGPAYGARELRGGVGGERPERGPRDANFQGGQRPEGGGGYPPQNRFNRPPMQHQQPPAANRDADS